MRPDVVDILAILVPIHKQLCAVSLRRHRVSEGEVQRDIPALGEIKVETCAVEAKARFGQARERVAGLPALSRWLKLVEALALGAQSAFIQWSADVVLIVLAAQIAGQFPLDGLSGATRETISQDSARRLHLLLAHGPVLVQTHEKE